MSVHIESLRKDYHSDKVVPFIGAGLSVPFRVPTWGDLIKEVTQKHAVGNKAFIMQAVQWHLETKDYWGALNELMKFAHIIDADIQEAIVALIKERQIKLNDINLHNYSDIGKMNFKLHLTTNYENLLNEHLNCEHIPILLKDIDFSTQKLFDEKRVCHLHGYTSNSGTIVISEQSYKKLYVDKKYDNILKLVTGSKKLLFMGFSFDDQFIQRLIKDHMDSFQGTHYIILANPPEDQVKKFREEYGLLTIPYSTEGSSHAQEIRKILNAISTPFDPRNEGSTNNVGENDQSVIVGAGLSDINQNVEENLFYKKLKLECIEAGTMELAKLFYIAAEKYIRQLKKSGMDINVIDAIFYKVFGKYKERFVDTYKQFGDSHEFVKVVHKSLEIIDFGRYAKFFQENQSDENENRGLIHLLADENEEVWWGDKRLADL
ncbi:SIR2 family protein [Paenibacillus sp. 32352]|uniref:SIR2 family NAD-dependent protein deacylase n=1 Tax=Paenibacillus sp. 32352 TaxID=1969111 RepID=UPI0009AD3C79|nr:SIR2 family protein [Paenibacillus sp. 32352]